MRVLLAVDSVTTLHILLDEMATRSWPSNTEVQLISVVEDGEVPQKTWREEGYGITAVRREIERRGEQITSLAVNRLRQMGISCRVVIMRGSPAFLISFVARKWNADLILIRAHNRRDFRNWLLGSVASSVVDEAPCSVEIIRNSRASGSIGRGLKVLLATDGSDGSIAACRAIAETQWPEHSEIKVVSVISGLTYSLEELWLSRGKRTERAHHAIGDALEILSPSRLRISGELITGNAARKIVERADNWQADLIVLGTNEPRGLNRLLLGSTSAAVANRAHCSVRVIRGQSVARNGNSLSHLTRQEDGAYKYDVWRKAV